MINQNWNDLSLSSKTALRWAAALALCRSAGGSSAESGEMVNVFDLFVGLVLAHPDQSEPQAMLDHFQISLGQLLPNDYESPNTKILEFNLRNVPDREPWMESDVTTILDSAQSLHNSSSKSSVVEHRFVFAAMLLETNNQFTISLQRNIEKLGSTVSELGKTTLMYLNEEAKVDDFANLLTKKHPLKLRSVELPSYQCDHGKEANLASDLVGIRAEVDAFAYLLGSRDLNPPLAIGLFGDWGSGKSFFMEAVENRLKNLTEIAKNQNLAQKDVPFWKNIVQIRFNAWHYVEGELWASLVEHIFSQLKFESNESKDIVEERRLFWTKEITGKRDQLDQLEADHRDKQQEKKNCLEKVANLRKQQENEVQNLENLKSRDITQHVLVESLTSVRKELESHFEAANVSTFGDAIRSIQEAKSELQKGGALLRRCTEDRETALLCVSALFLVPLIIYWLQTLNFSPFVSFLSKLSAIIAPIIGLVHRTTSWMRKQRAILQKIETQVRKEIEVTRQKWDNEIQGAEKKITNLASDLDENLKKQAELSKDLAQLEEKRRSITSISITNEFIAERTGSDDYRCLLGIPALIQRDFLMLSELVRRQNQDILNDLKHENSPNVINRIILYIDDLDRCKDKHVIKVLQAVHLLLAFDLFVVLVAVDARWLNNALVKYYPALVKQAEQGDHPTADDYLEKIFQIPFWIEPLVDDAKRNIIGGLLRGQLAGGEGGTIDDYVDTPLKIEEDHQKILDSMRNRGQPLSMEASDLSVSQKESMFLSSLAPLLVGTPRTVKRFVNLYQLLRIIHQPKPEDENAIPSDHEILAFALAIGDGLPRLASPLFKHLMKADDFETITVSTNFFKKNRFEEEATRLLNWLECQIEWSTLSCRRMKPHVALAQRFLFRVGGYLEQQEVLQHDLEAPTVPN